MSPYSWPILLFFAVLIPLSQANGKYYYPKLNASLSSIPDAFEGTASVFFPMREYKEFGISCWKVVDCRPDAIQTMKKVAQTSADSLRTYTWILCFCVLLAIPLALVGVCNMEIDEWWPPFCFTLAIWILFIGHLLAAINILVTETQHPLLDFCYDNFNYAQVVQV